MSLTTQHNLFQEIIIAAKSAGFGFISDKSVSRTALSASRAYLLSALIILALSFSLVLSIFGELSEKLLPNIPLLNMNSYALIVVVFYTVNKDRIITNFHDFINLKDDICSDEQGKDSFCRIFAKYSKLVNGFVRYMFWYNLLMISADILVKILCRVQIIDINGDNYLLHEVSFDATSTEVFWPTFIIQASSLHLVVVTQMFNDLYIFNLTIFLAVLILHLREKLGNILLASEDIYSVPTKLQGGRSSSFPLSITTEDYFLNLNKNLNEVHLKVKQWVGYHAQLLRLCNEFNELYHPVLLAYFANKFINVCFGMFMITQGKQDFFNGFETIAIISYFLGNAICLLALCIAGTYLIHESRGVFDEAFHSPWYRCLPATKSSLSIIACMTQKPARLTVLSSTTAEMSIDTFIWVFKAIISYYITLTQFKQQISSNSNSVVK